MYLSMVSSSVFHYVIVIPSVIKENDTGTDTKHRERSSVLEHPSLCLLGILLSRQTRTAACVYFLTSDAGVARRLVSRACTCAGIRRDQHFAERP